jgi:excinuclease UvrABC helicase subunit UvrB
MLFELQSSYQPAGDQIKAIDEIKKLFEKGKNKATLL